MVGGGIYTSNDYGYGWSVTSAPTTSTTYWKSVASDSSGKKLVAVIAGGTSGGIYTSTDYGANWTLTSAPSSRWVSVASSANGTKLVAVNTIVNDSGNKIYTSIDSGATWTLTSAPPNIWSSVASSADGNNLVAVAIPKKIYISTNSGATWSILTGSISDVWSSVAISADGSKIVAVVYGGGIYTYSMPTPTPSPTPIPTYTPTPTPSSTYTPTPTPTDTPMPTSTSENNPWLISQTAVNGSNLVIVNDYLYNVNTSGMITQLSLSNPIEEATSYYKVSTLPCYCLASDGIYLYTTDGTSVYRIDISNPMSPVSGWSNSTCSADNTLYGIAVNGPYLYVSDANNLYILNKSDGTIISNKLNIGKQTPLATDGYNLFMTNKNNQILFCSLDNLTSNMELSYFNGEENFYSNIVIAGRYLYASNINNNNITQFDLNNWDSVGVSTQYGNLFANVYGNNSGGLGLTVDSTWLYANNASNGAISRFLLPVDNPSVWINTGAFTVPTGLIMVNNYLFTSISSIAGYYIGQISLTDINVFNKKYYDSSRLKILATDGLNYLFARDRNNIYQVNIGSTIPSIGWTYSNNNTLSGMTVSGSYLYVIDDDANVCRLDIATGNSSIWVTNGGGIGLATDTNNLYVSNYSETIAVYNLTDGSVQPSLVGTGFYGGIVIHNGYLYALDVSNGNITQFNLSYPNINNSFIPNNTGMPYMPTFGGLNSDFGYFTLAIDSTWLYTSNGTTNEISRFLAPINAYTRLNSTISMINGAFDNSFNLTTLNGFIYVSLDNSLLQLPLNGTPNHSLNNIPFVNIPINSNYIANDGTYLYNTDGRYVYKLNPNDITNPMWTNSSIGSLEKLFDIAVYGTYVYVLGISSIFRLNTSDGTHSIFKSGSENELAGLAIDENYLYLASGSFIYVLQLETGTVYNTLFEPNNNTAVYVNPVIYNGDLYVFDMSKGSIMRFNLNDQQANPSVFMTMFTNYGIILPRLTFDNEWFYCINNVVLNNTVFDPDNLDITYDITRVLLP